MTLAVYQPDKEAPISITAKAIAFFQKKLRNHEQKVIRISVKKSGCTGYSYVIDYGKDKIDGDEAFEFDGVQIHISAQAVEMIKGSEIDLAQQGLNQSIVFNNPNVTASCGCGSSFSVDEADA